MFKGFDVLTPEEWASVMFKSGLKEMEYVGGNAVRKLIVGSDKEIKNIQIVTTNESPPSQPIPWHHELAQTPNPPSHISFFCQLKGLNGGSTPIVRSDLVYDYVARNYPELLPKFEEGLKYTKRVPEVNDASSPIGNSWKSMFKVDTREQAEEALKKINCTYEWTQIDDGTFDCKITTPLMQGTKIASNGKKSFFN